MKNILLIAALYVVIFFLIIIGSFLRLEFTVGILNFIFILLVSAVSVVTTLFINKHIPKPNYIYIVKDAVSILIILIIVYYFIGFFSTPQAYVISSLGMLISIFVLIAVNIDRLIVMTIKTHTTKPSRDFVSLVVSSVVIVCVFVICFFVTLWGGFNDLLFKIGLYNEKRIILAEEISLDKKTTASYNIIPGQGLCTDQIWVEIKSTLFPVKKIVFYDRGQFYIVNSEYQITNVIPKQIIMWEGDVNLKYWRPFDREPREPIIETVPIPWYLKL